MCLKCHAFYGCICSLFLITMAPKKQPLEGAVEKKSKIPKKPFKKLVKHLAPTAEPTEEQLSVMRDKTQEFITRVFEDARVRATSENRTEITAEDMLQAVANFKKD